MNITDQIEQESVDVSIWGSADGENWGTHPILKLPQQFYRGETRAVLDLTLVPEINFIRAGWELNRWGRVAPLPMFVLGLHVAEIPAMPARDSAGSGERGTINFSRDAQCVPLRKYGVGSRQSVALW